MAAYTWSVDNASAYKGDMVVRQYSSFNLGSGDTLTPAARAQGVMLFVDGDATINGTITVRGAYGGTPADNSWNMGIIKSGSTGVTFSNSITEWGRGSTDANTNLPALETIMNTTSLHRPYIHHVFSQMTQKQAYAGLDALKKKYSYL